QGNALADDDRGGRRAVDLSRGSQRDAHEGGYQDRPRQPEQPVPLPVGDGDLLGGEAQATLHPDDRSPVRPRRRRGGTHVLESQRPLDQELTGGFGGQARAPVAEEGAGSNAPQLRLIATPPC